MANGIKVTEEFPRDVELSDFSSDELVTRNETTSSRTRVAADSQLVVVSREGPQGRVTGILPVNGRSAVAAPSVKEVKV